MGRKRELERKVRSSPRRRPVSTERRPMTATQPPRRQRPRPPFPPQKPRRSCPASYSLLPRYPNHPPRVPAAPPPAAADASAPRRASTRTRQPAVWTARDGPAADPCVPSRLHAQTPDQTPAPPTTKGRGGHLHVMLAAFSPSSPRRPTPLTARRRPIGRHGRPSLPPPRPIARPGAQHIAASPPAAA